VRVQAIGQRELLPTERKDCCAATNYPQDTPFATLIKQELILELDGEKYTPLRAMPNPTA
jgi:hypothetical protein